MFDCFFYESNARVFYAAVATAVCERSVARVSMIFILNKCKQQQREKGNNRWLKGAL